MSTANENLNEALTRFCRGEHRMGILLVYLFGSRSMDLADGESDVAAAVLLDRASYSTRRERFEERLRLSAALISVLGRNDIREGEWGAKWQIAS